MIYTQEDIQHYFEEEGGLFILWDGTPGEHEFFLEHTVDYMSIYICQEGKITFNSHGKQLEADRNCVQFFMKDHTAKITSVSKDYRSIGILFSKRYWTESLMHINPDIALSFIQPSLRLKASEIQVLMDFMKAVKLVKTSGEADDSPILRSLFVGLLFQLGEYYKEWAKSVSMYSDAQLIVKFTQLLFENCHQHRDVTFYADALNLDRSKFSQIIKNSFGLSALHSIDKYIFSRICADLNNTKKSIKEIALDYNFHDTSHLCKFFRKMCGISPDTYRQNSRQQLR